MKIVSTTSACALAACAALAGNAVAEGARSHPKMATAAPLARSAFFPNHVLPKGGDPGDDDTAISLAPTLSALCQSYIGQLNVYANPRPNVDQINGDQLVLAGTQLGCETAQNETTIAVNPSNPRNLVAGTNDYRVFNTREGRNDGSGYAYTTYDGGHHWLNVQLPHLTFQTGATGLLSDMDSAGDPAVAFGPHNTVYYANLVFSRLNNGSGVVVSKSTDGGRTWGEPSIVHTDGVDASGNPLDTNYFNDKEWITVDQHSGTVYVTWTSFGLSDSPIQVSSSSDGGATWSAPVAVNPSSAFVPGGITAYSSGSNPQVNRRGDLFIAYESAVCQSLACDQPTDHDAVIIATSRDGGRTFTNQEVAYDFDFPFNPDTGRDTLTGENFRINSFPQLTIDPVTGALYAAWSDDRDGQYDPTTGASIKTNGDVFIVTSRDGRHWSQTYGVGTDADEVYPAIAAYGGQVAVSFYTRVYDPNGIGLDVAYVSGEAEDLGRLGNHRVRRVTSQTSNPQIQFVGIGAVTGTVLQGEFIGDYTAVALGSDGVLHPCWTDFRGSPGVTAPNQDAYTQAISLDD
ncbi:MAG TPA: sialidase family protein [Steroidobacteraceae bacterium]|nr:sialidase family protein [Steroidobacteraceae bacterium]